MNLELRTLYHYACLVLGFLAAAPAWARAEGTAEEYLERFEAATSAFRTMSFNATSKIHERGNGFAAETLANVREFQFVLIDDSFRFRCHQTSTSLKGVKSWIEYETSLDAAGYRINYRPPMEGERERWSVRFGGDRGLAKRGFSMLQFRLVRVLFGQLPLDIDRPLSDIMRTAGVTLQDPEIIDGRETLVLKSRGPYGVHTIWLDPIENYLPRRILVEKAGRDSVGVTPLNELRISRGPRQTQLLAVEYEVSDMAISHVKGNPVLTSFKSLTTFHHSDHREHSRRAEHVLSNIDFNPDPSQLHVTMQIPNGTRVRNEDANEEAVEFVWEDGKVVQRPVVQR